MFSCCAVAPPSSLCITCGCSHPESQAQFHTRARTPAQGIPHGSWRALAEVRLTHSCSPALACACRPPNAESSATASSGSSAAAAADPQQAEPSAQPEPHPGQSEAGSHLSLPGCCELDRARLTARVQVREHVREHERAMLQGRAESPRVGAEPLVRGVALGSASPPCGSFAAHG